MATAPAVRPAANDDVAIPGADRPQRSLTIKGLMPGLVERGKIKIGQKGREITSRKGNTFQPPQKLDHFVVTTLHRGADGNFVRDEAIHKMLGEKPTEIPVVLVYDDIGLNFPNRYAWFAGKKLACTGDGESAERLQQDGSHKVIRCPCPRAAPDFEPAAGRCKMTGSLSVIIQAAPVVGGVWKLRTTSYNTIVGLMSSMALIKRTTGGPLAGIPLTMTLSPKTTTAPDGKQQTVYIVGLEYRGSAEQLQDLGYERALRNEKHQVRIAHIEDEAKRLLLTGPEAVLDGEDPEDIVDEFYPEQHEGIVENLAAPSDAAEPEKPKPARKATAPKKAAAKPEPEPAEQEPEPDQGEPQDQEAEDVDYDEETGEVLTAAGGLAAPEDDEVPIEDGDPGPGGEDDDLFSD